MITVTALFTQSTGEPATGLALADIDLYLYRRAKATGVVSTVWTAQNPTQEVGGGLYCRSYTGEDTATYEYFGHGQYTGVTVLDSNYALQIGTSLDDQAVRDAMKLAPTAGTPAAGSVDDHLDDIQAITDEIDVSAVTAVTLYDGGTITLIIGSVFDETLSGVTVPADWQTCVWTVKRHRRQVDAKAILQVLVTNPADGDDGLQVLNSAAPISPIVAANASVTVNAGASTVRLLALDMVTAELDAVITDADEIEGLYWDVKFTRPAGVTPVPAQEGDVTIRYAATHAH